MAFGHFQISRAFIPPCNLARRSTTLGPGVTAAVTGTLVVYLQIVSEADNGSALSSSSISLKSKCSAKSAFAGPNRRWRGAIRL